MGCSPSLPRPGVSAGRCTRTPWSLPAASSRASASRRARCSSYAASARCPNPNPNPNPNASPNPNLTLYPKHPARQEVRDRLRHSRAAAPDAGEEHRGQRVQARPPLARRAAGAGVHSKVDQVRSHVARVSPTLLILPHRSRSRRPTRRACPRPAPTTRVSLAAAPARPPAQVSR